MADNFNLAKFLRNNRLLNESIGGYKDIRPLKENDGYNVVATNDDNDLDDPNKIARAIPGFDPNDFAILYKGDAYGGWQDNPNTDAVIASLKNGDGEFIVKKNSELSGGINEADDEQAYFDYKRSEEDDIDDPDADIVNDFVQGMRPYYEKDPSFIKRVVDAIRGKGFGAKMYDAGFRMNEAEFQYDDRDDVDPLPSLSPKFNISQDDFFGRMMDLAHEEFKDVSDIVSMTIDSLRHGGFDDRDILNFLATDFSLDEGLAEAESITMEGEEFEWKPIDQQGKTPFKNLTVTITDDKINVLADDGFSSQSYTKDDIKDAMKTGEYLRFRGKNLELNTKMKAWANS